MGFSLRCVMMLLLAAFLHGGWAHQATTARQAVAPRLALNHVVIAVRDLEKAAEQYRRIGFSLKPGQPHENGIRNFHAKFPDGTELELLTVSEARDSLTAKYLAHLKDGDGPAYLAFYPGPDAERPAVEMPRYVFFSGLNHSPTDRPEHFAHSNTAVSLTGAWVADPDLGLALARAKGAAADGIVNEPNALGWKAGMLPLEGGEVHLLPQSRRVRANRPIVGVVIRVKDLAAAQAALRRAGVKVQRRTDARGHAHLLVAFDEAHGVWLDFTSDR